MAQHTLHFDTCIIDDLRDLLQKELDRILAAAAGCYAEVRSGDDPVIAADRVALRADGWEDARIDEELRKIYPGCDALLLYLQRYAAVDHMWRQVFEAQTGDRFSRESVSLAYFLSKVADQLDDTDRYVNPTPDRSAVHAIVKAWAAEQDPHPDSLRLLATIGR